MLQRRQLAKEHVLPKRRIRLTSPYVKQQKCGNKKPPVFADGGLAGTTVPAPGRSSDGHAESVRGGEGMTVVPIPNLHHAVSAPPHGRKVDTLGPLPFQLAHGHDEFLRKLLRFLFFPFGRQRVSPCWSHYPLLLEWARNTIPTQLGFVNSYLESVRASCTR